MKSWKPEEEVDKLILFADSSMGIEERLETLPAPNEDHLRFDENNNQVKYLVDQPEELSKINCMFQRKDNLTGYDGIVAREGFFENNEVEDYTGLAFDTIGVTQNALYCKHVGEQLPEEYAQTIGYSNWTEIR